MWSWYSTPTHPTTTNKNYTSEKWTKSNMKATSWMDDYGWLDDPSTLFLSPPRFPPGSRFWRTCGWGKGCRGSFGASQGHGECRAGVAFCGSWLKKRHGRNTGTVVYRTMYIVYGTWIAMRWMIILSYIHMWCVYFGYMNLRISEIVLILKLFFAICHGFDCLRSRDGALFIPKSLLILSMRTPWSRSIWNQELPLWKAGVLSMVNLCQCLLLRQYGCDLCNVRVSCARVVDNFHSKYFGVRFPDCGYVFRFCWDFISGLTDVVLYRFGMIWKYVSRPVGPGCSLERLRVNYI